MQGFDDTTPAEDPIDTLTLLGIAVGLAMDAFAVAIATGIALGTVSGRQTFRLAFNFGLFQFLMPVIGYLAGMTVERYIRDTIPGSPSSCSATSAGRIPRGGYP